MHLKHSLKALALFAPTLAFIGCNTASEEYLARKTSELRRSDAEAETKIAELQKQVEEAARKVSDIALQAIEGASGSRALKHVNQIALEQAKQRKTE